MSSEAGGRLISGEALEYSLAKNIVLLSEGTRLARSRSKSAIYQALMADGYNKESNLVIVTTNTRGKVTVAGAGTGDSVSTRAEGDINLTEKT